MVGEGDVTLDATASAPEPADGEALVAVRYLSIDPTIRTWMDDAPGYLPPIQLGEVVRSAGIGEVVASRNEAYPEGSMVFGTVGWQDFAVADGGAGAMTPLPPELDPLAALSVFGVTGLTAYFGLLDVGQPKAGDTVVVSGAAGATGSVVGQLAKVEGAGKVVGIAGSADKCQWLLDELGFDEAINYRTEDVGARLGETCPNGIDVFFDNVGGRTLEQALDHLAMRARVVLCGAISQYTATDAGEGVRNTFNLIISRARMEGFLILDYLDRFLEAQMRLGQLVAEGRIKHREHVVEGLEHAPEALNLLFSGANNGKVIVKL
jgi:NADPH-dependent curcumin reductase CurA